MAENDHVLQWDSVRFHWSCRILTERFYVLMAAWLPGSLNPTGNEWALVKVNSYVTGMENLLTQTAK